jgi:L-fuculose-phosphate aldolase
MSEGYTEAESHSALRAKIKEYGEVLLEKGLTKGTGGNLSQRIGDDDHIAISPSGIPYEEISETDVPLITLEGERVLGKYEPSVEAPMHVTVYRERVDAEAIVHTHSPYATTLATIREPIPPSHYLIAGLGGKVPLAEYETFGTEALGRAAVDALADEYDACLLKNHGVLALGDSLESAVDTAVIVEYCARIHYQARLVGTPELLPEPELDTLEVKFEGYGQH